MRTSQIALLSAAGALVLTMMVVIAAARFNVRAIEPAQTKGFIPVPRELGERVTREVALRDFSGLALQGPWDVNVQQGAEWSVELEHPDNITSELNVEVRNGQLLLEWNGPQGDRRSSLGRRTPLFARVVMPRLDSVRIVGTSQTEFDGFGGERLEVHVSGAANVVGEDSRYASLDLAVSGAGRVDLREATFTDAHVDLAGAADVELSMNGGTLSGSLAGAGNIRYRGSVAEERVDVSGFGRVRRVD